MSNGSKASITCVVLVAVIAIATVYEFAQLGRDQSAARDHPQSSSPVNGPALTIEAGPTSTTGPPVVYRVRRGETLTSIAQRFGVTVAVIIFVNRLANPNRLTEGQTLLVPQKPPLQLVVTPAITTPGGSVRLKLTGTAPSQTVTFTIDSPAGPYVGPPHTASSEGTVTATYIPAPDAASGFIYNVTAKAGATVLAKASFRVG
jgi:LysM repeat protein